MKPALLKAARSAIWLLNKGDTIGDCLSESSVISFSDKWCLDN